MSRLSDRVNFHGFHPNDMIPQRAAASFPFQEPFHHALPVNDLLFREDLYLTHAGWERIAPGSPYPNPDQPDYYLFKWEDGRTLPSFTLAWMIAGTGGFETKRDVFPLAENDVFVILPGEWHRHRPNPDTGWVLAWIEFNGSKPNLWLKEGAFGVRPNRPEIPDVALFALQFSDILRRVRRNPAENTPVLAMAAAGLLSHVLIAPEPEAAPWDSGDPLVDAAIACIWNFSHGVLDVPAVAGHVGVGRRTLERRFHAVRGQGVLEEIRYCRFHRASLLLAETDLPLKSIIGRAGFSSYEQCRQAFSSFAGTTPSAFRNQGEAGN